MNLSDGQGIRDTTWQTRSDQDRKYESTRHRRLSISAEETLHNYEYTSQQVAALGRDWGSGLLTNFRQIGALPNPSIETPIQ